MRVYREASSRVGAGFTTPRKMSYCPDNRVINFRSRQPFECGRPRGPSCAILRRRRRCKYIYYDHPCRPGSAGKKGDFFFPPLSRLSSLFLELSRLGGRRDREANLRLLWTASSLSYLFPFFCFFPFFFFYLEFFYAKARSSVVRRIRVFSRSNLRIHEMHETVVRKLAFLIV